MSIRGLCDACHGSVPDHYAVNGLGHPYVCRADDDLRRLRYARGEGRMPPGMFNEPEAVDGCMAAGCLWGRHGLGWFRPHAYEPPPPAVLLERMRERRMRRIERRVKARGTWDIRPVYHVWLDEEVCDDWEVTRTYLDWHTAVSVTRERLRISKFTVPEPIWARRWSLYSDEHGVTAIIDKSVVGTLVRP